jgi:hypothetical protein
MQWQIPCMRSLISFEWIEMHAFQLISIILSMIVLIHCRIFLLQTFVTTHFELCPTFSCDSVAICRTQMDNTADCIWLVRSIWHGVLVSFNYRTRNRHENVRTTMSTTIDQISSSQCHVRSFPTHKSTSNVILFKWSSSRINDDRSNLWTTSTNMSSFEDKEIFNERTSSRRRSIIHFCHDCHCFTHDRRWHVNKSKCLISMRTIDCYYDG